MLYIIYSVTEKKTYCKKTCYIPYITKQNSL